MASSDSPAADGGEAAARSFMEQLTNSRNRDLSFFLPFILGFSSNSTTSRDEESAPSGQTRDRIILINPVTQGMIVIEGSRSLEDFLRDVSNKEGLPPASKASIEAMPKVVITEENGDGECSICLEEWEIGGEEVREMPCKHRFHGKCIEKWLGIHGSCPVCRFKMPVDEEEGKKTTTTTSVDGEEHGEREERGEGRREIWVSFSFSGRRRADSNSDAGGNARQGGEEDGGVVNSENN